MANKTRRNSLIQLILGIAIVVILVFIGSLKHSRFDLTSEGRYSLSDATKELLDTINNEIFIKVYLDGDLQYDYERLSQATKDILEEFRIRSNDKITYVFVNPNENPDEKQREELFIELTELGLTYSALKYEENGSLKEQIIFPGAIMYFNNTPVPIQFMKSQLFTAPNPMAVQNAINNLEYEFAQALRKQLTQVRPIIGIVNGQGQLDKIQTYDIRQSLQEFYDVQDIKIDENVNTLVNLRRFNALIIAQPDSTFSEQEKFMIDQFIMKGGKTIWMIDALDIQEDSLRKLGFTVALNKNLNLDDQLYRYGVRLNKNVVLDNLCAPINIPDGQINGKPHYRRAPWYFYPTILSREQHPITGNIDPVLIRYAGTLDFVGDASKTSFTPILQTSNLSMARNVNARINLNIVDTKPNFAGANQPFMTVGAILEGEFESVFSGRVPESINQLPDFKFVEKNTNNRMIVIADGDLIRNSYNPQTNQVGKLGYFNGILFGNSDFFMNAVDYLMDDQSLLTLRSRTITLRKLNEEKVKSEKTFWQSINIVVPIILIILFGFIFGFYKKLKYSKK